jgi:hypothetical protein
VPFCVIIIIIIIINLTPSGDKSNYVGVSLYCPAVQISNIASHLYLYLHLYVDWQCVFTRFSDNNVEGLRKIQLCCPHHLIVVEVLNFETALYRGWRARLLKEWDSGMLDWVRGEVKHKVDRKQHRTASHPVRRFEARKLLDRVLFQSFWLNCLTIYFNETNQPTWAEQLDYCHLACSLMWSISDWGAQVCVTEVICCDFRKDPFCSPAVSSQ